MQGTFLSFNIVYTNNQSHFAVIALEHNFSRCFRKDKTASQGKQLESLTSQCGFKQVISDPTHILESN